MGVCTRGDYATLHIMKAEAGLDDKAYRDLLFNVAAVRSSKDFESRAVYLKVVDALEQKTNHIKVFKQKRKPLKKEENLFAFSISKPHDPWKWMTPNKTQIAHLGDLIERYAENHITVVGVLGTDGQWKLKWRKMQKGRDY